MPDKDVYAVRREFKDEKHQLGLFHVLENAKKLADKNYGYKVWNIETKKCVYEPKLTYAKQFIGALQYMDVVMHEDLADGHVWRYSNGSLKKSSTFELTRKRGQYAVNCVDGVQWGMRMVGATCCSWYGQEGGNIQWLNDHAKADVEKRFNLIHVGGKKTVRQLLDAGELKPGDILTYVSMSHTNAYLGKKKSFDSGHAHCTKSGEKAPFYCFIGPLTCGSQKVGWIMRWKEKKHAYRVQVGAFETKKMLEEYRKLVKEKTGYDCFAETEGKLTYLYCGSFETESKAKERLLEVQFAEPKAFIKEVDLLA